MAKVGAKRASELTGKSKSTIQRAMKNGKISYEVDDSGRRLIDVSELERVYGLSKDKKKSSQYGQSEGSAAHSRNEDNGMSAADIELLKARHTLELERLTLQNRMLNEQLCQNADMIADLKAQRDQWQKQAQQVLLTSQHSQKQSDERIAELREREEARIKRAMQQKQQLQQKARMQSEATRLKADNENQKGSTDKGAHSAKSRKDVLGMFSQMFSKKKSA